MVKTIIFDYDGTIHQTLGIYEPAFRETYQWLTEQKVAEEQKIASSKIAGWLGLNSKEMWDTFMPELDQKYKDQASKMVGERMIEQVLAEGMIHTFQHPKIGPYRGFHKPVKFGRTPGPLPFPAPMLGQHNNDLLHENTNQKEEK